MNLLTSLEEKSIQSYQENLQDCNLYSYSDYIYGGADYWLGFFFKGIL